MVMHGMHTEILARHEEHSDLYWFGPPKSKTLRPIWWGNYATEICPEEGAPGHHILADARRPWATSRFPSLLVGYNMEGLSVLL
jgi:hypothetical protein